jgi:hypothetical protein
MMRIRTAGLALTAALMVGSSAWGQRAAFPFIGGNGRQINHVPIVGPSVAPLPLQPQRFRLSQLFRRVGTGPFPPRLGQSALPPPSAFPSTRYKNFQAVPVSPANNFPPVVPSRANR